MKIKKIVYNSVIGIEQNLHTSDDLSGSIFAIIDENLDTKNPINKESSDIKVTNTEISELASKNSSNTVTDVILAVLSKIYSRGNRIVLSEYEEDILLSYCSISSSSKKTITSEDTKFKKFNKLANTYLQMSIATMIALKSWKLNFTDKTEVGFKLNGIDESDSDFLVNTLFVPNFWNAIDYTSMLYWSDDFFNNIQVYTLTEHSDYDWLIIELWADEPIDNNHICITPYKSDKNAQDSSIKSNNLANYESIITDGVDFSNYFLVPVSFYNSQFKNWAPEFAIFEKIKPNVSRDILEFFFYRIFRKKNFREWQYEAIARILSWNSTLVLLPTGTGKSIVYQLAWLLLPGTTIIVCPLISLIEDQLDNLSRIGITNVVWFVNWQFWSKNEALDKIEQNAPLYIYVSPEKLKTKEFAHSLWLLKQRSIISLCAIDEAHCSSEWWHDFRTSYSGIRKVISNLTEKNSSSNSTVLTALTGTASNAVLKDMQREMNIYWIDNVITPSTFIRKELNFTVVNCSSGNKYKELERILKSDIPEFFGVDNEKIFTSDGENTYWWIIFCPHSSWEVWVDTYTANLRKSWINAKSYGWKKPTGMSDFEWENNKSKIALDFKDNKFPLLVATKWFWMGVDKPNIRYTVHIGIPNSIESFYQEAGRSWRNWNQAKNYILVSDDDLERTNFLLDLSNSPAEVSKVVSSVWYWKADDITRALWFHFQSFKGVTEEIDAVNMIIDSIGEKVFNQDSNISESENILKVVIQSNENNKGILEKAIQRLELLWIILWSEYDYASKEYVIQHTAYVDYTFVIKMYLEYLKGYWLSKYNSEWEKIKWLQEYYLSNNKVDNKSSLIKAIVWLYIRFVYETIEKWRRRQIKEMLNIRDSETNEQVSEKIANYLEWSKSELMERLINDTSKDFKWYFEVVDWYEKDSVIYWGIISYQESKKILEWCNRYLEQYPDNLNLNLLRSLCSSYILKERDLLMKFIDEDENWSNSTIEDQNNVDNDGKNDNIIDKYKNISLDSLKKDMLIVINYWLKQGYNLNDIFNALLNISSKLSEESQAVITYELANQDKSNKFSRIFLKSSLISETSKQLLWIIYLERILGIFDNSRKNEF